MIGAILGDIVGSVYEFNNIRTKDFEIEDFRSYFTDDTVMTIAVFRALYKCKGKYKNLSKITIKEMQNIYNEFYAIRGNLSYGSNFIHWLEAKKPQPYNSYGNGSAMRVSAIPYFAKSEEELKDMVYKVTTISHNHLEGIKGAEATALCIYLALNGASKEEIKQRIEKDYYSLNFNYEDLRANYRFEVSCQETVPQAIYCFLISNSFEDALRTGISIGGDSDTLCAILGGIAEAYYPKEEITKFKDFVYSKLNQRLQEDLDLFCSQK